MQTGKTVESEENLVEITGVGAAEREERSCDHHWIDDIRSALLTDEEREDLALKNPDAPLPGDDEPIWCCTFCDAWLPATECEVCGDLVDPDGGCVCEFEVDGDGQTVPVGMTTRAGQVAP